MTERALILVTNDDGVEHPGLWALAAALQSVSEVLVVAPAFQHSGVGTALTLHRDLQSEQVQSRLDGVPAFQVDGTPGDAVIIGLRRHTPRRVSLVVAGVNPGPNLGADLLHSGTVGAAMQGHHRGLPALAVSLNSQDETRLSVAASIGARVADQLLASGAQEFLNVNVPDRASEELGRILVTRMAQRGYGKLIDETTPGGTIHWRQEFGVRPDWAVEGTDVWAVAEGHVSVTPLHTDLTHAGAFERVGALLDGMHATGGAQPSK